MNQLSALKDRGTYVVKTVSGVYEVKLLGKNKFHVIFTDMRDPTSTQSMELGGGWIRVGERMVLQHSKDSFQTRTAPVVSINPK